MEIILLERVEKLGQMGDVVRVRDGFARNFLLPRKKALRATDLNRKLFESQRADLEARNIERRNDAEQLSTKIDGRTFVVIRQASDAGMLFGSVSTRDIAETASAGGVHIDRAQVRLDKPLKQLGIVPIKIVLHPEVSVSISINVARSEEEAERQARGENVLARIEEKDDEDAGAQAEFFDANAALDADAENA